MWLRTAVVVAVAALVLNASPAQSDDQPGDDRQRALWSKLVVHQGKVRIRSKPAVGTPIEFSGTAVEFTKSPFMLPISTPASMLASFCKSAPQCPH